MTRILTFITLLFFLLFKPLVQGNETEKVSGLSIAEINSREEVTIEITKSISKKIREIQSTQLQEIDFHVDSVQSILEKYAPENIETASMQGLKNIESAINGLSNNLKSVEKNYLNRVSVLQESQDEIKVELEYWEKVKEFLSEEKDLGESFLGRVANITNNLNTVNDNIIELINDELDIIGYISDFNNQINKLNDLISERSESIRYGFLVKDSEPIWRVHKIENDTLAGIKKQQIIEENFEALKLYLNFNGAYLILHLSVILLFFLLFFYNSTKLNNYIATNYANLLIYIKKPLFSSYLFSFLVLASFNAQYPIALVEFFIISLCYPIYELLKPQIKPSSKKLFFLFISLFLTQIFFNHISYVYVSGRIFLLIYEILCLGYFLFAISIIKNNKRTLINKSLIKFFAIALSLFSVAFISNIIGAVKLSALLATATINLIGIGILIYLYYQISKAILVVLTGVKPINELNIVKKDRKGFINRFMRVFRIFLIFIYLRTILNQFKIRELWIQGWNDFINKSWEIGSVQISIGEFLGFFVIVTITIILARFLKYLLGGEILPRITKKRGVPNAIATSVFYIIMVIGLFLAAFSTGIEWSKINLALGAIGVGIGFGLQTLVYNFIAGLVLTYERPVQVGDIVQFKTLMGEIKDIGIRSSRVLTYDGAEVVVPNGDLISNEMINWTLSNNLKRQELKLIASSSANPNDIVQILRGIALENPKVIAEPNPLPLFEGYTDEGTLSFRLLFWTPVDKGLSTKSEVALAIFNAFEAKGYEIPAKRSTIRIEKEKEE